MFLWNGSISWLSSVLFLHIIHSVTAMMCHECRDYRHERTVCSPSIGCSGPICFIVHFESPSSEFVAGCYPKSLQTSDYCYSDNKGRILCACISNHCNTLPMVHTFKNVTTNLLAELDIDKLLGIEPSFSVTTPKPGTTNKTTSLPLGTKTTTPMPIETTTKKATNPRILTILSIIYFLTGYI